MVPFEIRYGKDSWEAALRRNARCSACGARGAEFRLPSHQGHPDRGAHPFPVEFIDGRAPS